MGRHAFSKDSPPAGGHCPEWVAGKACAAGVACKKGHNFVRTCTCNCMLVIFFSVKIIFDVQHKFGSQAGAAAAAAAAGAEDEKKKCSIM